MHKNSPGDIVANAGNNRLHKEDGRSKLIRAVEAREGMLIGVHIPALLQMKAHLMLIASEHGSDLAACKRLTVGLLLAGLLLFEWLEVGQTLICGRSGLTLGQVQ